MDTDTPTNGTEHALVPVTDQALVVAASGDDGDTYLHLDHEITSAQRQIQRGLEQTAEAMVRLAMALETMEQTHAYQQAGFANFDTYMHERHGMSQRTARQYIRAIRQFGEADLRQLFLDVPTQRAFLAARIKEMDAEILEELVTPLPDGQTALARLPVHTLEQTVQELQAELAARATEVAQLASQVQARDQIMRQKESVIERIQAVNFKVGGEADELKRQLQREEQAHEQTRKRDSQVRQQLQREIEALRAQGDASPVSPPDDPPPTVTVMPVPAEELPVRVVERLVGADAVCDPQLLADLVRATVTALRRYQSADHPLAEYDAFTGALCEVIATGDAALLSQVLEAGATGLAQLPARSQLPREQDDQVQEAIRAIATVIHERYR